jgi:hypothetical protein
MKALAGKKVLLFKQTRADICSAVELCLKIEVTQYACM